MRSCALKLPPGCTRLPAAVGLDGRLEFDSSTADRRCFEAAAAAAALCYVYVCHP
jgi:hypothetical protein